MAFSASRLITGPHITPKSSPHLKSPTSRLSPVRGSRNNEQILNLKQVIGTTATSNNGFACLGNGNVFAFIAGSGAVLATLGGDQAVSQRFFRARPSATPLNSTPSIYDSPTPIGPSQAARSRAAASLRDGGFGSLSLGSPMNDYVDSPGAKSATRTKASTCISLSADGRLLAIGETGHKPRVLIFSTARDAPTDVPLTALSEHTFEVRCLAFSTDSQYLASLGDMNDGFLYVWNVNQRTGSATLHASNKCTSNIRQIAWMGNSLITVGTRHVKVWRVEDNASGRASPTKRMSDMNFAFTSPTSRALAGRNCLLGALLDKTFTAVATISPYKAIVCAEQGDICLLDDSENPPQFVKIADAGFPITAIAVHSQKFAIIAGTQGQLRLFDLDKLKLPDTTITLSDVRLLEQKVNEASQINVVAFLGDRLLTIDGQRSLQILDPLLDIDESVTYSQTHRFPAHGGAVLGIHAFSMSNGDRASFLTWSAEGTVLFWNSNGICKGDLTVTVDQQPLGPEEYANELKVVRCFRNGAYVVSGDKFGVIKIIKVADGKPLFETKAHTSDMTDITLCEKDDDSVLIASSGRDRIVQLFRWRPDTCEHLQTLEEHTGAITGLIFSKDGGRLISCSSDRSIMIMEAVYREKKSTVIAGFLSSRPLTLKASPVSMDLIGNDTLLVSTVDRNVSCYDLNTGNLTSSFKSSDQEGGDAVVISSVVHLSLAKRSTLVAGVSGTDKSIRIYDESGRLLEREYGHTEGMTGIAVVPCAEDPSRKTLVTVATDGTVFVWDPASGQDQLSDLLSSMELSGDTLRSSQSFSSRPALRKVLSSSELTRLQGLREEAQEEPAKHTSPAPERPQLKKRSSKLSLVQTPKLEPTVGVTNRRATYAPVDFSAPDRSRRGVSSTRACSPSSPRQYANTMRASSRPPTSTTRPRRKSAGAGGSPSDFGNTLAASNESVCRSLHVFRKKLATSSEILPIESVRELERELSLTAKALAEKSKRSETAVARLLDQYSERLVEMLEGRIEKSVERQMQSRERDKDSGVPVVEVAVASGLPTTEEVSIVEG